MQGNKVFRQAVLDRLASPEQLHTLMRVTDAKGWLALLGCALLLGDRGRSGAIRGSVPTKLQASGILIHSGGLADVVAVGAGQITALEVDVGDVVTQGPGDRPGRAARARRSSSPACGRALVELRPTYEKAEAPAAAT